MRELTINATLRMERDLPILQVNETMTTETLTFVRDWIRALTV